MSEDRFSEADHQRAQLAGQAAMAKIERQRKSRGSWGVIFLLAALTQFVALVVAVIQFWHPVAFHHELGITAAFTWPVLVSPHWLALVAAFAAFCVTGFTQVALSEEGAS